MKELWLLCSGADEGCGASTAVLRTLARGQHTHVALMRHRKAQDDRCPAGLAVRQLSYNKLKLLSEP